MEDITKQCGGCKEIKLLNEFNNCKRGSQGKHNHCKICQKMIRRNWYLKNKESETIKSKIYSKTEQARLQRSKRYIENKAIINFKNNERRRNEKAKILQRIYEKEKRLTNPNYRIAQNLRARIRVALKGIAKSERTKKLLGCNFEELKVYLQSKFLNGMTWENYGLNGWHIDHILPCDSFDLTKEENQMKCFHYTNLQPLWAKDNLSKSNTIAYTTQQGQQASYKRNHY